MDAQSDDDRLTLRWFDGSDERQLRQWLKLPHVVDWWGGLTAAEASIALASTSDGSLRCMIIAEDTPIGYAHAIDANLTGADQLQSVPPGAYEADLFIAHPDFTGKGYGVGALERFTAEIFATLMIPAVVVRMPVSTEQAVRNLERRGFRWTMIDRTPGNPPRWVLIKPK